MGVREHGTGPAVVLLPGGEPVADWFPLTDVLARTYRVLLGDLPRSTTTAEVAAMLAERGATRPLASWAHRRARISRSISSRAGASIHRS